MLLGKIQNKLHVFVKISQMLFLERHELFYKQNKIIAVAYIFFDSVFINPIRKLVMIIQEKASKNYSDDVLIESLCEKTVEFLLFRKGHNLRPLNKQQLGDSDFFRQIEVSHTNYYIQAVVNKKFPNDKCYLENESFVILFDGILFNIKELFEKYSIKDISELLIKILESENEENFLNEMRGEFSAILYDKKNNKMKFFVDHFSMKKMYYYNNNNNNKEITIVSTNFDILANYLIFNGVKPTLSVQSAYMLLTLGYLVENNTIIEEIKKLEGGLIGNIIGTHYYAKRYYYFDNRKKVKENYTEIIEKVDELFRRAIKRQFEKNVEYGYKQLCTLSGGLDSRMVLFVAYNLGYKEIKTITFSQSRTWDEKIAKDISNSLGLKWDFFPLDDARHVLNLNYGLRVSGQTTYSESIKGANYFYSNPNLDYGLIHTGQLGDAILGYFGKAVKPEKIDITDGTASYFLITELSNNMLRNKYINQEEFFFTQRLFNSTLFGNADYEQGRYSYSPFLDVDFFNYCISIPDEYRLGHKIYKDWILKKYPEASNFKWEKLKNYFVQGIVNHEEDNYNPKYFSMNPYETWYLKNIKMRVFIKNMFNNNIYSEILKKHEKLQFDLKRIFKAGCAREKLQVITVLGLIRRYWDQNG